MSREGSNVKHANSVFYSATSDGCLVTQKTTKRHHALDTEYRCDPKPSSSRDIEFKFDLGAEYVDAYQSYLKFSLEYNTSVTSPVEDYPAKLSSGFTDLVQDILLLDRNGVTIERVEHVYQVASMLATSTHTTDSLANNSYVFPADKRLLRGVQSTVVLPLHFLLGFFRTDTLIPPHILDRATMRIRLRDANLVFSPTTTNIPNVGDGEGWQYSVHNPLVVFHSYVFDHRLHNLITEEYNGAGLHFPFTSHTHIGHDIPNTAWREDVYVNQSFSRATKVLLAIDAKDDDSSLPHLNAYFNNTLANTVDGERVAAPWVYKSFQARINDVAYPNSPLDDGDWVEAYHLWLTAFRAHRGAGVSAQAKVDFIFGERVLVDLDRGTVGHSSGQVVNNRFPVVIRLDLDEAVAHDSKNFAMPPRVLNRRLHMFVEHQRVLLAKQNNHIVVA